MPNRQKLFHDSTNFLFSSKRLQVQAFCDKGNDGIAAPKVCEVHNLSTKFLFLHQYTNWWYRSSLIALSLSQFIGEFQCKIACHDKSHRPAHISISTRSFCVDCPGIPDTEGFYWPTRIDKREGYTNMSINPFQLLIRVGQLNPSCKQDRRNEPISTNVNLPFYMSTLFIPYPGWMYSNPSSVRSALFLQKFI